MNKVWKLTPKNWAKFQHYSHRRPPWVKLHRGLLDDYTFSSLPLASKALAPLLWVLASEHETGLIELTTEELAFRVRMTVSEVEQGLLPLISKGFFSADQDIASKALAGCQQVASLEREIEKEVEKKEPDSLQLLAKPNRKAAAPVGADMWFEKFWQVYPRKVAKPKARMAWRRAITKASAETIIDAVIATAWKRTEYDPHPASWLNAERWNDERPLTTNERLMRLVDQPAARGDELFATFPETNIVRLRA